MFKGFCLIYKLSVGVMFIGVVWFVLRVAVSGLVVFPAQRGVDPQQMNALNL